MDEYIEREAAVKKYSEIVIADKNNKVLTF